MQRAGDREERAGLRVEVVDHVVRGDARRALVDDDVPLGDDIFRLQVRGDLVGVDLDVLVVDLDVRVEDGVLVADDLLVAPFRDLPLDLAPLLDRRRDEFEPLHGRRWLRLWKRRELREESGCREERDESGE